MAASIEARSGLAYGWDFAEDFKPEMDSNLLHIGRFGLHLSILDRGLTAPPVSPSAGDTYIIATAATGDWVGKEDQVAVYDGSVWVYAVPRVGWVAYIEDEEVLSAYKAGGWSAGVAI